MASPSPRQSSAQAEHKEGVRCDAPRDSHVKGTMLPPWKWASNPYPGGVNRVGECGGLILEHLEQVLGIRCYKKGCRKFYPLEVLLSQAVEQNLLSPEQREAIRRVIAEEEKPENKEGGEMTTATKHSIEISPKVHPAIDPAGAIEAIAALDVKRVDIFNELIRCHFPTFDSGELKARASRFVNILAQGTVERVEINVVFDDRHHYATWLKIFFSNGNIEKIQDSGWSMLWIAKDAAYKFQAFANLMGVEAVFMDETSKSKV